MEIKRSEVYFNPEGNTSMLVAHQGARDAKKGFIALGEADGAGVYHIIRKNVCRPVCEVADLTDDRESPFPPMAPEVTSDTVTDRILDAAMRERYK